MKVKADTRLKRYATHFERGVGFPFPTAAPSIRSCCPRRALVTARQRGANAYNGGMGYAFVARAKRGGGDPFREHIRGDWDARIAATAWAQGKRLGRPPVSKGRLARGDRAAIQRSLDAGVSVRRTAVRSDDRTAAASSCYLLRFWTYFKREQPVRNPPSALCDESDGP